MKKGDDSESRIVFISQNKGNSRLMIIFLMRERPLELSNSALVPATKGVVSQRTVLHQGLTISTSGNVVSCSGLEIGTRMERVEAEGGGTAKRKQGSSIKGVVCNRQEQ